MLGDRSASRGQRAISRSGCVVVSIVSPSGITLPYRAGYPRKRRARPVALLVLTVLGLLSAAAGIAVIHLAREIVTADLDAAARSIGLGIEQVDITGHRLTSDREIFGALELGAAPSHLSFDPEAARSRIERLAWVKSVAIQRTLPGGLAIVVTERQPVAVWQRAGDDVLVDRDGRELGAVRRDTDMGLPIVSGDGAGPRATEILDLLAQHPLLAERLRKAHRVADRRWTLELTDGTLLHLPAEAAAAALTRLGARYPSALTAGRFAVLDLRVPGQLLVRRR